MKKFFNVLVTSALGIFLALLPAQQVVYAASSKPKRTSKTVLHVKFNETDEVSLQNDTFTSKKGRDVRGVNNALSKKTKRKNKLFRTTSATNQNSYYRIVLNDGQNIEDAVKTLKQNPAVSEAYAEPLPAPAPASPNFAALQAHFGNAPTGMGITSANAYAGASGDYVRIADLEYSWNIAHEDLSDARQTDTIVRNGTPVDPFNDTSHGTSVAGLLNGDKNTFGINGIVPNAKLHLINTNSAEMGWDIPNAVVMATNRLGAGDVMLIEQQTWAPDGQSFAPAEWVPAVYDAIKAATSKGIIVVEAAGNGNQNLNSPAYGTSFPMGKPDSGAIIVGAGAACAGSTARTRMYFSNYGSRVNVQGHGECVTSSGYGDLFSGSANATYTSYFSGTSSASALVAATAASVSSAYEAKTGKNLTPAQLRTMLVQYGTPQNNSLNPGNIGPLPNLEATLKSFAAPTTPVTDKTPPTSPTKLAATVSNNTRVSLKWNASTDNSGKAVTYRIFRNNVQIATTTNRTYTDTKTARRTTYSYKIQAVDTSNNVSGFSNTLSVKTK